MCVGQLIWRETKLVEKHWSFYLINNSFYLLWRSRMSFCSEYFTIRMLLLLSTRNILHSCGPSVWSGSGLDINCRVTGEGPNCGPGRDSSTVRSVLIVVFSSRRWEMIPTVLLARLVAPAPRCPSIVNIVYMFHLSVNSRGPLSSQMNFTTKMLSCCRQGENNISSARASRSHTIMQGRTAHRTDVMATSFQHRYLNKWGFLLRKRYTKHKTICRNYICWFMRFLLI